MQLELGAYIRQTRHRLDFGVLLVSRRAAHDPQLDRGKSARLEMGVGVGWYRRYYALRLQILLRMGAVQTQ